MAFWLRIRLALFYKLFRMRGFWLLALWVGFNDILPMVLAANRHQGSGLGTSDGVAHWAHVGGFLAGMAFALGLLFSRLSTARGSDLLSVALGKAAWPLLGKPSQHLGAAIAPTGPSIPRRVVLSGPR
jgi:hypothetical protein